MSRRPTAGQVAGALRWWSISFAGLKDAPIYTDEATVATFCAHNPGAVAIPVSEETVLIAIGDTAESPDDGILN